MSEPPVNCFPGYIFNFASTASKKLSESVAETAQNLKKSVEEGKINGIIDKVYTLVFWSIYLFLLRFNISDEIRSIICLSSDHIGGFPERAAEVCGGEKSKAIG